MQDPNSEIGDSLIAQHAPTQKGQGTDTTAHESHNAKESGQDASLFENIFKELSDHHAFELGPDWIHFSYPVFIVDDGVYVYASVDQMHKSGLYELSHTTHHIERSDNHKAPLLDLSITGAVFFQWVAILVLLGMLVPMGRSAKRRGAKPFRGLFNAIEAGIVYVRDEIVVPNIGARDSEKLLPIFLTFFFFILVMNIVGLLPGGHSATANINVTGGLAICAFAVMQLCGILKNGIKHWLKHLTGGTPWAIWIIMVPIEVIGLFTKPFSLCIRLFANMTAGHIILLSLIGLSLMASLFTPVTWGFSLFINILELLVVVLQAYVFTTLTAVFTGMGMESHDDHH